MIIEQLSYHNHVTGWQLAPISFGRVNLLVGVSGVGKTKILESIITLNNIVHGESFNGVEWDVTFSTSLEKRYRWNGKFSTIDNQDQPKIATEYLYENDKIVASKENDSIVFKNQSMPKLSPSESLIKIFMAEDEVIPIAKGWSSVAHSYTKSREYVRGFRPNQIAGLSLSEIRDMNINLIDGLGLLSSNCPSEFEKIKSNFVEIFPQIKDIRILTEQREFEGLAPTIIFSLEIKEIGVDKWITYQNISIGMLKTLALVTDIYLIPEHSILLIDEFENSLGVNCIDVIDELLSDRQDVQFIITSHHPYLINKIPMQYWKIITRRGSVVTVTNATDYEELSGSRHKVFTQLINLPAYTEGIQAG